ncbi:MAG: glutamine synthetase family protein [Ilumatobacteraceae bacterium]
MGNRRVRVMWSDLNGLAHGRYIPEGRLGEHGHHAVTTLVMAINGDILPVVGYAADVGFRDLTTVPLVETRRPGWEPDTDVVVADLMVDGAPLEIAPRSALQRAVDAWRSLGYEPQLGFELEFFLFQPNADSPGGFGPLVNPSHRVYGVGLGADPTGVLLELYDAVEHSELDLEGVMGEFHPGQMEINLRYGPAMDAADRAFVCKELSREVAAHNGHRVTYMGRPSGELVGSGLHVNFSLLPVAGGANAFDDASDEVGLSALARQCLGGLIAHHEGLAAFSAPLVNSYKRLVPGIIAGYWANWGLDNRISTFRIPGERGMATRIENRMPCASASPYLAAAAMLNAALLGVVDGLDCGLPQLGDGDAEPNTSRHTPEHLGDELDALEADAVLCEAMGHDLVRAFLALRHEDLGRWLALDTAWDPATITAWELEHYLPFY